MMFSRKKQTNQPGRRREGSSSSHRTRAEDLDARYSFRRNRTLTGSLSSDVASAGEHRAELKSPRVHAHDLKRHRRRLGLILFGVAIAGLALFVLIYQSIALVHVSSLAPKNIDTALYQSKIQDYLTLHPFERSRMFLDTEALSVYLQSNGCPELAKVLPETRFDGLGASKLTLEFRRAVVTWTSGSQHLYVDENGVAFTRHYYPDPPVKVVDKTGIQSQNNQVLASNRFLGYIGMIIGSMRQYNYTVTSVTLPEATTRQIAINIKGHSYTIKFSVDRAVGEQAEDAFRAITYLDGKGTSPEYVDVRTSGKAFYK
ncbi:hypothetical protein H7Y29_03045 [Microbacteriaceae bacterium]|nr:hypothetical protein [Candidatus Saccharibacteria bacterium]